MLMGTLKETLIFVQDGHAGLHRYEIYKSDLKGGYFAVIYFQKTVFFNDAVTPKNCTNCLKAGSGLVQRPRNRSEQDSFPRRLSAELQPAEVLL
ncbi:hypothetical protein [Brenneria alni]|nr:hypothetical protein [Brenneria alni]